METNEKKVVEMVENVNGRIEMNENAKTEKPSFLKCHGKKIALCLGAGLLVLLGISIGSRRNGGNDEITLLVSGNDDDDSDEE